MHIWFCWTVLLLLVVVEATKFPNDIEGIPEINCEQEKLSITVKTTSGTAGHIFAKGRYGDAACNFNQTNSATFSLSGCGMNRQRQLDPKGLSYNLVVVVQLHPRFITKVDRAYHIKCFYMETDKTVSAGLDVSMLTTDLVTAGHAMPQCMYKLHMGSPTGPPVKYAKIGDKVWHVWECPSDVYGMLIHSCAVDDGQGNTIRILDENGCGVDKYVMKTPEYTTDLTRAQQETHVFKFADKVSVFFNCQIKLCFKNEACQGVTPPRCPDSPKVAITGQVDNPPLNRTKSTESETTVKVAKNATDNQTSENLISTALPSHITEESKVTVATSKNVTPPAVAGANVTISHVINATEILNETTTTPQTTATITSEVAINATEIHNETTTAAAKNVSNLNTTEEPNLVNHTTGESLNVTTIPSAVTTSTNVSQSLNTSESLVLANATEIVNATELTNATKTINVTLISTTEVAPVVNATESFSSSVTANVTETSPSSNATLLDFTSIFVTEANATESVHKTNVTETVANETVVTTPIAVVNSSDLTVANFTEFPQVNSTGIGASANDSPIAGEEFGGVGPLQVRLNDTLTSDQPNFSLGPFEGSGEELPPSVDSTTQETTESSTLPTPSTFVPKATAHKTGIVDEFVGQKLRDEGFWLDEARGRRNALNLAASTQLPLRDLSVRDDLQLDVNQEMLVLEPDDADQFLALQQPNTTVAYRNGLAGQTGKSTEADDIHQVCLSPLSFGVVLSSISILILFCLSLVLWICIRKPNRVGVATKSRVGSSSVSDLLRHSSVY